MPVVPAAAADESVVVENMHSRAFGRQRSSLRLISPINAACPTFSCASSSPALGVAGFSKLWMIRLAALRERKSRTHSARSSDLAPRRLCCSSLDRSVQLSQSSGEKVASLDRQDHDIGLGIDTGRCPDRASAAHNIEPAQLHSNINAPHERARAQ